MIEKRSIQTSEPLKLTKTADGKSVIEGYAVVFNSPSVELRHATYGKFVERVAPGAVRSLTHPVEGMDIISCIQHDEAKIIGRQSNGSLELRADSKGIWMRNVLPDTQVARDLATNVKAGLVTGQSYAFTVDPGGESFTRGTDGIMQREIRAMSLMHIGPVSDPCYSDTTVSLSPESRSLMAALTEETDVEESTEAVAEVQPEMSGSEEETNKESDGSAESNDWEQELLLQEMELFTQE